MRALANVSSVQPNPPPVGDVRAEPRRFAVLTTGPIPRPSINLI